jgi:hypothetical protein
VRVFCFCCCCPASKRGQGSNSTFPLTSCPIPTSFWTCLCHHETCNNRTKQLRGYLHARATPSPHLHFILSPQDWQNSKLRQDAQLDRLEKGVATLNDMAKGMQVRRVVRICVCVGGGICDGPRF